MTEEQRREIFPCSSPRNGDMRDHELRLATFDSRWGRTSSRGVELNATSEEFASAGFYFTGERDQVKCWYCDGAIAKWDPHHDPFAQHAKYYPKCEFLLQCKGHDFVDRVVAKYPHAYRRSLGNAYTSPEEKSTELGQQRKWREIFPCSSPHNGDMRDHESRLATFDSRWGGVDVRATTEEFASAGFYFTGESHPIKCWYCGGEVQIRNRNIEPWVAHSVYYPRCEFLLQCKGRDFVDDVVAKYPNMYRRSLSNAYTSPEEIQQTTPLERQQRVSDLSDEQYDQVYLYKIFNDRDLKKKIRRIVPISQILGILAPLIKPQFIESIQEIARRRKDYAAVKSFFKAATSKQLVPGWSRKLLCILKQLQLEELEVLNRLSQADLDDFKRRIGIPRNSLLHEIAEVSREFCSILLSPMGYKEGQEESDKVPVVHPQLCVSEDHFRRNNAFADGKYRPLDEGRCAYKEAETIPFKAITGSQVEGEERTKKFTSQLTSQHAMFLMLIGPAGSGKTTLTKRLVKTCNADNKMAFFIPFHKLGKTRRWSLKNLLLKLPLIWHLQREPSQGKVDRDFAWILANQDKCVLVLDGYDQSPFKIKGKPLTEYDVNKEYLPHQLMDLILSRRFLPGIRIVLTSRPHSVVEFRSSLIKPTLVVFVNDLTQGDMEALMGHYIPDSNLDYILETLQRKSPQIHKLVFSPLFLRMFAILFNDSEETIWEIVSTTARMFFQIIDFHQDSAHYGSEHDINELNEKLGHMAYIKTMEGSVVFEKKDLDRHTLTADDVQDLVFAVLEDPSRSKSSSFTGLMIFYFNHQSIQEFFSAKFALETLEFIEFADLVRKIFPLVVGEYGGLGVASDPYLIVRMFVIGCINEMESRQLGGDEIMMKKDFFLQFLCDHLRQIFVRTTTDSEFALGKHQAQLLVDLLDLQDGTLTKQVRQNLKSSKLIIPSFSSSTLSGREGLFHFLRKFATNLQSLQLDVRLWKEDEIIWLKDSINSIDGKIDELEIAMHPVHIPVIISILPKLSRKVKFRSFHGDDLCTKLKEEFGDILDPSDIRTKRLDIEVVDGDELLLQVAVFVGA